MKNIDCNLKAIFNYFFGCICLTQIMLVEINAKAQIIPDQTLNIENSQVLNTGNQIIIQGGSTRGKNLFHSFSVFSLNDKKSVLFRAENNISNIFSRVTGTQASKIDGILSTSGIANLFIINPNGISIGPNAKLDINGSFLATTSNKFIFNYSNSKFNLLNDSLIPDDLISFNSINLVFENNPNTISISNTGHTNSISPFSPINESINPSFMVKPGQTLGLFGSRILSDGGILSAPSGDLAIGSIKSGSVNVRQINNSLEINLVGNPTFGDISLNNRSSFSANSGGKIKLFGRNINILDASTIYSKNQFNTNSGLIDIYASELINISGKSQKIAFRSSVFSDTISSGIAPNINIKSKNILVTESAFIGNRSFDQGRGGKVNIEVSESIDIIGSKNPSLLELSAIFSTTFSSNASSDINISAKRISLEQGGSILTTSLREGNAGDIKISASESIDIVGFSIPFLEPSTISAASFRTGNGGSIFIQTGDLRIAQGGSINSSILDRGKAGEIDINASKSITLTGLTQPEEPINSNSSTLTPAQTTINSNAIVSPIFQPIFNFPSRPSGDSGQVIISSPSLFISNGATIGAFNQGTGTAGNLIISSGRIELKDKGAISASTFSGRGGNIQIFTEQLLTKDGILTTSALGNGIGGNILIDADLFVSFGESIISANAFNAKGGNITFNTKGFLSSTDTKITATSALGEQFDGTITFSNPDRDLGLANTLVEAKPQESEISSVCNPKSVDSVSEFFIRGDGGLPMGATDQLTSASGWHDPSGGSEQPDDTTVYTPEIVHVDDAQGMVINPDGTGSLVSYSNLPINKAEKPNNCNAKISPDHPTGSHPQPNRTGPNSTLSARFNTPETTTTKAPTHSSTAPTP